MGSCFTILLIAQVLLFNLPSGHLVNIVTKFDITKMRQKQQKLENKYGRLHL